MDGRSQMTITGVILAAGTSSRMGSANKLLLKYNRHTVIEEVLKQLSGSRVDEILIVTGYEHARIEAALAGRLTGKTSIVYNRRYRSGRAESIRCAVTRLVGRADAALFMVGDKPGISSALINRAVDRFRKDRPAILFVETPAGRGHPIIFSAAVFGDLMLLQGDCVGDNLVAKYKDDLVTVKDKTPQIDIDNEADYRILLQKRTRGKRR